MDDVKTRVQKLVERVNVDQNKKKIRELKQNQCKQDFGMIIRLQLRK